MEQVGFYVTVLRGAKVGYLLGPYDAKEAAEANVQRAAKVAGEIDPWAVFDAFGVTKVTRESERPLPRGVLNARIELEGEIGL